ncbi:alpha/beta hydrolase [Kordiimonas aestuarii]|uniref:alpha/beta hydrolase n=1 Tax=Kordiimonas aestuarii TaxID=1005925 RepID=UPI0021D36A41|nr:alpha/beta hydrolase [Kordiimonas aestuarii]
MNNITRATTAGFALWCTALAGGAATAAEPDNLKPCFLSGVKQRVQCASFDVPLDYSEPGSGTVTLHATIVPAKASTPAEDPFLVFAGGPGQAAGDYGMLVHVAFDNIRTKRDIILLDQRGTGRSAGVRCDGDEIPEKLSDMTALARQCRESAPIDVRHITMENVVRDAEEVRARLGYETLNLWGGSYGTRTVALYLRRYPERVRSIVVDGVLPPDVSLFETSPQSAERAKHLIAEDCAANTACAARFPNFEADVDALMAKAKAGELHYSGPDPVTGETIEFDLQHGFAVEALRGAFYTADTTTYVPLVVDEAVKGNLNPLIASLLGATAISESMYLGTTYSILCGDEIPRLSEAEAVAAGEGSFAEDSYYRYWKAGCAGWDSTMPESDALTPIEGDVPALVLSGNLDPITPPSMGDHFVGGFPNGRHIVVPGTGHNTSYVACMPSLMADFIENLDVSALDISCFDHLRRLPLAVGRNGNTE